MTAPVPPPMHATIDARDHDRLDQLAQFYAAAKPAYDEAKERLDEITDAIKYELTNAAPGVHKVDLTSPALVAPLRMSARTTWRLDSKRLKAEAPATYVQYAKQSTYWELRAVTDGGSS